MVMSVWSGPMQHGLGTIPGKASESNCEAAAFSHLGVLPTSEQQVDVVALLLSLLHGEITS